MLFNCVLALPWSMATTAKYSWFNAELASLMCLGKDNHFRIKQSARRGVPSLIKNMQTELFSIGMD